MTPLRRLKTLEAFAQKLSGPVPNTCITVDKVLFEKDDDGHVVTRVPEDAVYKDANGAIVHKEGGVWKYEDGSLMPVSGLVVIGREGHTP